MQQRSEQTRPHEDIEFVFVSGSFDATSARGRVLVRDGEMILDIEWQGTAYHVPGQREQSYFIGTDVDVRARWADLGTEFVGVWIEKGHEWFFRFRLPARPA